MLTLRARGRTGGVRRRLDSRFRGNDGVESGNDGVKSGITARQSIRFSLMSTLPRGCGVGETASRLKSGMNRERQISSPLMGLQGWVLIFVIPSKAGIQKVEAKLATRNQARIARDKFILP